jgi:FKBP-type peptidyl-prolyl cis-trans isomerase FkpA
MRTLLVALTVALFSLPAFAAEGPRTEESKTLYALGLTIARQLSVFGLSPAEFDVVGQGLMDGVTGAVPVETSEPYARRIKELATARRNAQGEKLAAAGKEYIEKAAKEKGSVKTSSGFVYLSLREGTGAPPAATDRVKVDYRGTLVDGKEFDSSYRRGQPAEFALDGVIKCWTEGLQMMKPGGKARLVCPPELAYGKGGSGLIPANATLIFEVELLEVKK